MESKLVLKLKDYQVFVHGHKDEQDGVTFIRTPENVSDDLKSRNLGGSRYLNLHLIEDFTAKKTGNFGGSASSKQATMFESTSPIHFGLLAAAIEGKEGEHFDSQPDMEITVGGDKRIIPVIKLRGLFEDSAIHTEAVDSFYLAFKKDGAYELQFTDRFIGDEWITTPSENTTISVVLFAAEATEGNLIAALAKEARRMNVEAFNKDEIKAAAMLAGISTAKPDEFRNWFAKVAPNLIKKIYSEDEAEAAAEPVITQGAETKQPAPNAQTGKVEPAAAEQEVV